MDQELLVAAKAVLKHAYVKYSNFRVGAAIRLKDGEIISGANIENASYGLTNCAERSALYAAYSRGYQKEDIVEMVLTTEQDHLVSPCGACRQVMSELILPDVKIHMVYGNDKTTVLNKELLPYAFSEDDM